MAATRLEQPGIDDVALARALLARAPRAVENAFAGFSPRVQRYFQRFFGPGFRPGCDVADLCQETFLRFFSQIHQLRDPAGVVGFLYSKCLGVARNQRRRNWVRRLVGLTPSGELPDVPSVGGWDPESREATARVFVLLGRLGATDRSIFITRYLEQMEIAEIASAHGLTFATARRRVAHVTRRMSDRMVRDPVLAGYLEGLRKGASAE